MEVLSRFFQNPAGSFSLFGSRGTGKTTFLKLAFPQALRIELLSPQEHRSYLSRPERLEGLVAANPGQNLIVIDEIQKAPGLLDVVHRLMDSNPGLRFIMVAGVTCIPCEEFLAAIHPEHPLPTAEVPPGR